MPVVCSKKLLSSLKSLDYTGYWLRFYVPLNIKAVISDTFPKPISWLGMEKQNLTRYNKNTHSPIKTMYYNTK